MRILINALSARQGGGQTYLLNLLEHLPEQDDYEVYVYAPETLELPQHERLKRCSTNWPTSNPISRAVWEVLCLSWVLRKLEIDVLFCPGGIISSIIPHSCKTVTMFRNMMPFDMRVRRKLPYGFQKIRNWILERVMLWSMAKADLTIFISHFARQIIEARINIKNAVTIPHGINPAFKTYNLQLTKPSIPIVGKYILYVSKFDVYKHHYEVVKAYIALPEVLRKKYKLMLVGEFDEFEAPRVSHLINQMKMQDNICMCGPISYGNLPAMYHFADLILFASSCENCPNILLEALGAGRPVLTSNVMPMPEFGGIGANYFSPFDPADLSEKIEEILISADLQESMSYAAALRSEDFDWSLSAAETWKKLFSMAFHTTSIDV